MIYIRNIFTQDLRDGKQIAFTKEISNLFFNFNYHTPDPDRKIDFIFKEKDSSSSRFPYNDNIVKTRLYAASSESRIDGELKRFLIDKLNAKVDDILVFKKINNLKFEFEFFQKGTPQNSLCKSVLNNQNHQIILSTSQPSDEDEDNIKGNNVIYYGAPGTGKSHQVDQIIKNIAPEYYERITFHPDYDHTSFVGGYRPKTIKNEEEKADIVYEFVPQAFSKIYTRAWKKLNKPHYLVIEEINRGNCAEIFGDIFQLLDRDSNYSVSPSEELQEYLISQFDNDANHAGVSRGLRLPPNLFIYATMNTSDQSLFPMDSAFKRRWDWEYVPICYDKEYEEGKENPSYNFLIELPDGSKYRWIDFIAKINNNHIKDNPILGLDKCIGNYFIKPKEDGNISLKAFINKVVFYLWNDVFKDEDNSVFEENSSYEEFFPINSNGLEKIKELFNRIDLQPILVEESKYNPDEIQDGAPNKE